MRKIFVDSNYVIDHLRGRAYTKDLIEKIKNKEFEAHISVATVFELYVGALLSHDPKNRLEDIEKLLNWFYVIDINKEIMLLAAKIHVDLRRRGLALEIQDILIAATSISMDMALLTNNKKHFANIQGLRLE